MLKCKPNSIIFVTSDSVSRHYPIFMFTTLESCAGSLPSSAVGRFIHGNVIAEAGADEPLRSQEVEKFYTTWTWRRCRKAFAESKGNLCERCLSRGIIEPGSKDRPLEVHHKTALTAENISNPNVALNWDNLELLCKTCHDEERERIAKRWSVTPDGRVTV